MTASDKIRQRLKDDLASYGKGYGWHKDRSEQIGVSYQILQRFLNGQSVSFASIKRIEAWLDKNGIKTP